MNSSHQRESALFALALEKPAGERAAFLHLICGDDHALRERLEVLVAAHGSTPGKAVKDSPAPAARATVKLDLPDHAVEAVGTCISHYKLHQRLGEGGCGVVYLAEQTQPVRRTVALKVIKLGMDTQDVVARFEAERQALALMNHPNIAKVYDAGVTGQGTEVTGQKSERGDQRAEGGAVAPLTADLCPLPSASGRPFFVMELVQGVSITHYCDLHKLSTPQRLGLFAQVCQAIQHAHQKGIIHRDIKPSNILVTLQDGIPVPKVIDFGIAKAIGQNRLTDKTMFTAQGQFMGTPAYMSPEQAEMTALDIDTRTDIYSLGVLLYQLLTGKTPFDTEEFRRSGLDAIRRIIRENEPMRPSTRISTLDVDEQTRIASCQHVELPRLVHLVRGDLDWITMKCLEKDRTRRYESANDLAADVRRHLSYEPVQARPPSNLYRLQKTVRRHRLAFTAAVAVVVSLLLGLGTSTALFLKEQAARREITVAAREVSRQKSEAERRNVEYRAMLAEAARLDRAVAGQKLRAGQEQEAFAHLARACAYDPSSALAAQMGVAALANWNPVFPKLILAGHGELLTCAQFSPDGQHIVTASADKTARIWDGATGTMLTTFIGHEAAVVAARFSPDGQRLLTASADQTARVWDAASGRSLATLAGHQGRLSSAEFSPDGTRIVTASSDKTARVWDAMTGRWQVTLVGHERMVRSARFSPDGHHIVTTSEDNTARVWDVTSGQAFATLNGHVDWVLDAQFNPDGTRIVTASSDGSTRMWNVATGQPVSMRAMHDDSVLNAQFSPDGTRFVTASADKTGKIRDATTGQTLAQLAGHQAEVVSAQFSRDGTRIVTASTDKTARVWDSATGQMFTTLAGHAGPVVSAQFSPDGSRIVTASHDKTARVWDAAMGKTPTTLAGHNDFVLKAQFSPDDTRIVTASFDKTARVWNSATGKALSTLAGHQDQLMDAQFSPDGGRIVTASADKTARVWDANTGQMLVTLAGHEGELRSAQFSPDGTRIVTASVDKTARVWDAATGRTRITLAGHESRVLDAQFSPNGARIVTASHDKTARVWDAATGKVLLTLVGHEEMLRSARFSPSGTRIVTASLDRTARIWDAATGHTLAILSGHGAEVWSAQFSANARSIITASGDKTACVWDPDTGRILTTFAGHSGRVRDAEFSHDGRRIVTASEDKTARLWTMLPPDAGPPPEWFADFLRYVAQLRLNSDGELETLTAADHRALRGRFRSVLSVTAGPDTPYLEILRNHVRD